MTENQYTMSACKTKDEISIGQEICKLSDMISLSLEIARRNDGLYIKAHNIRQRLAAKLWELQKQLDQSVKSRAVQNLFD